MKERLIAVPFEMKIPADKPFAFESLTKEQFDAEIQKGYDSVLNGRTHSAGDVSALPGGHFITSVTVDSAPTARDRLSQDRNGYFIPMQKR